MGQQSAVKRAPSIAAGAIDYYAEAYQQSQQEAAAAKDKVTNYKNTLVKLVKRHGAIPDGAEKSLRLEGARYTITASFGTSSSVDEAVVEEIREELDFCAQSRLFARLFEKIVSHVVSPTAPACLGNCSKKVRDLFARVMATKAKEPSLKVEKKKGGKK